MKFTTSIFAIAFVAVPALAFSSGDYEQYERSVAEFDNDIYEREFTSSSDIVLTREDLEDLFSREFVDHIEERSPFGLGLLFKGVKAAIKIGKAAHKGHSASNHVQNHRNNRHKRSFDDEEEFFEREDFDDLD